jgi:hypothetical protein
MDARNRYRIVIADKENRRVTDIHVGDLVVINSNPSVIGHSYLISGSPCQPTVLAMSTACRTGRLLPQLIGAGLLIEWSQVSYLELLESQ